MERLEHAFAVRERTGPACNDGNEWLTVSLLGDEGERRRDLERGESPKLLRRSGDVVAEVLEYVLRAIELEEHRAAVDVLDGVQPELQ